MIYPFLIPIALVDILCAMSVMFTSGSKALLTSYCYHKYTASKTVWTMTAITINCNDISSLNHSNTDHWYRQG